MNRAEPRLPDRAQFRPKRPWRPRGLEDARLTLAEFRASLIA